MRSPETGGRAESRGGEGRIGWSPRQALQTELSINDEFMRRFLALFGDSPESRHAASTLLQRTSELSQHRKAFDLLILSEPDSSCYLIRRYTLLRFGSLLDRSDRLEVKVGRWGTPKYSGQFDTHLIFPANYFDRVAVADGTVVFTGSNSKMELDVFNDGKIGVRPKVRLDY